MEAHLGLCDDSALTMGVQGQVFSLGCIYQRLMKLGGGVMLLLLFFFLLWHEARGQQMYQVTQYMLNNYVVNPAVVGTFNYFQARTHHRFQWIGVNDAPITNVVTVYGPLAKQSMGFGALFYNDLTGPTSRTGLSASYGYNLALSSEMRLSLGLSLGFMAFKVDGSKFDLGDNTNSLEDPALLNSESRTSLIPDGALGAYIYASHLYLGVSSQQLFGNDLTLYGKPVKPNILKRSYYLHAGYLIYLSENFDLEPGVVAKFAPPSPFQFDIGVKASYLNRIWAGVSFRYGDAVSFLLGYKHDNRILFGYSFDYSYTRLRAYSIGSHELMIGYQFDKIK